MPASRVLILVMVMLACTDALESSGMAMNWPRDRGASTRTRDVPATSSMEQDGDGHDLDGEQEGDGDGLEQVNSIDQEVRG